MKTSLKTALFIMEDNFVGPEYLYYLNKNNYTPDFIISVGRFKEIHNQIEFQRTDGQWIKKIIPTNQKIYKFKSHKDNELWKFISDNAIDIIIQGGAGFIFSQDMINTAKLCVLNIHPGKLPEYRGNSAPEWAIYNGDLVHITGHVIDQGVDTGPIITQKVLNYKQYINYYEFRANVYHACADVLIKSLKILNKNGIENSTNVQSEENAQYRDRISDEKLSVVKEKFLELRNLHLSTRILREKDIRKEYIEWFADEDVIRFSDNQYRKFTLHNVKDYVKNCLSDSNIDLLGIFDNKKHIGNILIRGLDSVHKRAEISYVVGNKSYWGRGVGSFAVNEIIYKAKNDYKLNKLFAGIAEGNIGSIKVLEKNGFSLEGTRINHLYYGGKYYNKINYGLLLSK